MVVNHFKLNHHIHNFNLGGMGCGVGITTTDLAKDRVDTYPITYALVVSREVFSMTSYVIALSYDSCMWQLVSCDRVCQIAYGAGSTSTPHHP
ncbi:unnamed protein product [Sphenostylis stenocarpa]|uniref:FAE domain-containing protein n=1 Tax=Sphenostylis stenocarpa TaxID=92480 RepID=A0AA86VY56_9FABA|nr:unnamed protein product [Sphenostylis stenocarpa]